MSQKFKSDIEAQAGIRDSSGAIGTSGQVLSSTGSNVSWINQTTVASDVQNLVKAGVAINKGQAVYVTGANGTNIIVGLASNTSEATSSKTLGLLNATVAINGMADVVQIGRLAGLDTSTANQAGDPVWLGENGNLIYGLTNKPYAPKHLVFIGVVTRKNANNGEIFINVQNGFELNEIHDVDLKTTVPVNGDVLGFNGTLWVNKTIAGWLGYTPVTNARTLTINGVTQDLTANRSWTVTGGIVDITRNDLIVERNNSTLIPGTKYKITDSLQGYVYNLSSIPVIMEAVSASQFELYSTGLFYTVQYDKNDKYWGIWNLIVNAQLTNFSGQGYFGYGEQITSDTGATGIYYGQQMILWTGGNWASSTSVTGLGSGVTATVSNQGSIIQPSYSLGQFVRWGGQIWENISGNLGSDVSGSYGFPYGYVLDPSDWELHTSADSPGFYNSTPDTVIYDLDKDIITYREDLLGNKIYEGENVINAPGLRPYSNIFKFQWGSFRDTSANYGYYSCFGNIAYTNAYIDNVNAATNIYKNILKGNSYINNQYFQGDISFNELGGNAYIEGNIAGDWTGQIYGNILTLQGNISSNDFFQGSASENGINDGSINYNSSENGLYINSNILNNGSISDNRSSGSFTFNDNIFNNCFFNQNMINNAYISSNTFNRYVNIFNNTITNTQFSNNTLTDTMISSNNFINTAFQSNYLTYTYIQNNNCTDTWGSDSGGISYNETSAPYSLNYNQNRNIISFNTLGTNSRIFNNQLSAGSSIQNNTINSGSINGNVLNLASVIQFNNLGNFAEISNNTLSNANYIINNGLLPGGQINNNNITGKGSYIIYNDFNSSNCLIGYNNLNGYDSAIYGLTLFNTAEFSRNQLGPQCGIRYISASNTSMTDCILENNSNIAYQSLSQTMQYVTFQNVQVLYGSIGSATIIYDNTISKIVYNDNTQGNTISWYENWTVKFDFVTT